MYLVSRSVCGQDFGCGCAQVGMVRVIHRLVVTSVTVLLQEARIGCTWFPRFLSSRHSFLGDGNDGEKLLASACCILVNLRRVCAGAGAGRDCGSRSYSSAKRAGVAISAAGSADSSGWWSSGR